jgi:hypothetical protein
MITKSAPKVSVIVITYNQEDYVKGCTGSRYSSTWLSTAALPGSPAFSVAKERTIQPVRDVLRRGVREGVLRDDLPGDTLFEMFTALVERALWPTVSDAATPEAAAEAVRRVRVLRWLIPLGDTIGKAQNPQDAQAMLHHSRRLGTGRSTSPCIGENTRLGRQARWR